MPRSNFDQEQKNLAIRLITEGVLSVSEIAKESGITDKNIFRWKREMLGGEAATGNGNGRKRRRRRNGGGAEPEKVVDWELSYKLERLENEYLRLGLQMETNEARLQLEILYLRERALIFNDDSLTPLFYIPPERSVPNASSPEQKPD